MQDKRVVVARGAEAWREFEAALEQRLGIPIAAQPCRDLGEHPQRGHIRLILAQVCPQRRLRGRQIVCDERRGSGPEARIAVGRVNVVCPCLVRAGRIAGDVKLVGEAPPRFRPVWFQLCRAAQRRHGAIARACLGARKPQFEVHSSGVRFVLGKGLEHRERSRGVAQQPIGAALQQARMRVSRHRAQDLSSLFERQRWLRREQARGMLERNPERPLGVGSRVH